MNRLILSRKPGDTALVINGPTVLGKDSYVPDYLKKRLIEGYDLGAVAIEGQRISTNENVSDNHLFFYPDRELGGYRAVNIGNKPTFLNANVMPVKVSYAVDSTDMFSLGGFNLVVERIPYRRGKHFGLIVANDGKNLVAAVRNDAAGLGAELRLRSYRWNTNNLINSSKDLIFDCLDQIAEYATDDSKTMFLFSGHGLNGYGLSINNAFDSTGKEFISSQEFFERLNRIKGKHGVVLDCCNAGHFFNDPNFDKSRTAILAASLSDGVARNTDEQNIANGRFTRAFLDYSIQRSAPFRLGDKELLDYIKAVLSKYREIQIPDFQGCEFVLPARI